MSGGYALTNPTATYEAGQSIASLETDARAAGNALVNALGNVNPGTQHGADVLQSALDTFQTDCVDAKNSCANAVSRLGENTASGAQTGVETDNEGTHTANANTSLARGLNRQIAV